MINKFLEFIFFFDFKSNKINYFTYSILTCNSFALWSSVLEENIFLSLEVFPS
jgi:hypothetical protein